MSMFLDPDRQKAETTTTTQRQASSLATSPSSTLLVSRGLSPTGQPSSTAWTTNTPPDRPGTGVPTTTTINTRLSTAQPSPSDGGGDGGLNTGAIIGIVLGIISTIAAVVGAYYTWKSWRARTYRDAEREGRYC
ncbi:hypothetical protein V8F20_008090 [Naviculisporaceae sp. PSN 640]